ncbi:MAG: signal transduction histidine kinase [Oleispira sp.]|jgi:signal transduction histidine kinase
MCILFALIVNVSYTQLLILVTEESQDDVFNWHLAHSAKIWSEEYKINKKIIENSGALGKDIFIGLESDLIEFVSEKYNLDTDMLAKEFTSLTHWPIVNHIEKEIYQDVILYEIEFNDVRLHIAKAELDIRKNSVSLYYLVDVSKLYPQSGSDVDTLFLQVFMFLISTIFAIFIGMYLANRAVLPLSQLSNDVDTVEIGQKIVLNRQYYNDEIGILADKLRAMFQRIDSFVEREKSFSRDASHELRTPITNIQIAVELAKTMPQCSDRKVQAVLNRISRSNNDMIHLVKTFLLFGREESKEEEASFFNLHNMAAESLEKNIYLVNEEFISVINDINENTQIKQPIKILEIVLNNLIRNSFQYTHKGSIKVSGTAQYVQVEDTGIGFTYTKNFTPYSVQHESGLGLGLNIVQRICQLKGWQILIESTLGKGTLIRVNFSNK